MKVHFITEEEEDSGDENDDYWQHVVDRVVAIFKQSKGRDPTEEELKVLLEQLKLDLFVVIILIVVTHILDCGLQQEF